MTVAEINGICFCYVKSMCLKHFNVGGTLGSMSRLLSGGGKVGDIIIDIICVLLYYIIIILTDDHSSSSYYYLILSCVNANVQISQNVQ